VAIRLRINARKFLLRVMDDGVGFHEPTSDQVGMGLKIMRYRASMINAVLEIVPHRPHGTVVFLTGNREPFVRAMESANAT
jgi:signal transduction histidine kinase